MKFYKDDQGVVYAYEADGSQDDYILGGLVAITEAEADALRGFGGPLTLADARARLQAAATARRWEVETGGITLPSGLRVGTDREDQSSIANAVGVIGLTGLEEVDFKALSGWVRITSADLQAIAAAVGRHKQACYSAERTHHEAIAALPSLAAAQAYDLDLNWPASAL